jgi:hypothetical protein
MENFTHGIMAIDPEDVDENDTVSIVHFIGLWNEPTKKQFEEFVKEIKTDPEFGLIEIADRLVILPAPPDIVEMFSKIVQENEKSKLN